MSQLKSRVGPWSLTWKTIPHGRAGVAQVEITRGDVPGEVPGNVPGKVIEISWRKDADGIWLLLPEGLFGFDIQGERDDEGRMLHLISQRGTHLEWGGVFSTVGTGAAQVVNRSTKAKAIRVRAQMPGKILRVMVEPGQLVEKDQPIMVMEAMKMENEIRVSHAGQVSQVKVGVGQTVETGADLVLMEGK